MISHIYPHIYLSFILLFGVITSYEDIRVGKIRNKYVLSAFLFAALMNSLSFLGFIEDKGLGGGHYVALLINVVIAFLVGYLLWVFDLWTPGDAKLFSAYSALVPLTTYQRGYVAYFPSFTLLSNTFMPLFFLLLLTLPFSIKDSAQIRRVFGLRALLDRVIFLFGFLWFFDVLFSFLGMQLTFLTYFLLFMAMPQIFKRIGFISVTHASIMLSALRLVFDYDTVFTLAFLRFFISLVFVFVVLMLLIGLSRFLKTTTSVNVGDLRQGMILAGEIRADGKVIAGAGRGISAEEVRLVGELHKARELESGFVDVQQTLPFAPFLFAGVLLTFLCQGDLVVFLEACLGSSPFLP